MDSATLVNVELAVALVLNGLVLAGFIGRSQWHNHVGMFLLAMLSVLEVLMALRLFSRIVWPLPETFWAYGYALLDGVFLWLLWLLWRGHGEPGRVTWRKLWRRLRRSS